MPHERPRTDHDMLPPRVRARVRREEPPMLSLMRISIYFLSFLALLAVIALTHPTFLLGLVMVVANQ